MADCYIARGGGGGLNFKVKAYASELLLPATASENTIAIITSTPISSYIFSSTEPDAPEEGMVWIATSDISAAAFSATKKNPVMVYPSSAKQYISNAWVAVTCRTYQSGAWIPWETVLYNNGIAYVDWISKPGTGTNWTQYTASFGTEYMRISTGSSDSDTICCGVVTKEKIDISGYSRLTVVMDVTEANARAYTNVLITSSQTDNWDYKYAIAYASVNTPGERTVNVDFNASGEYYIDIFTMRNGAANIKKVYLS